MEISERIMTEARQKIGASVSDEVIRGLVINMPDEKMLRLVLPMMAEALHDIPEDTPAEEVVARVMSKLQKKAENNKTSNPGNPKQYTRAYFDSIWLEQRLMGAKIPDISFAMYGKKFASPIMTAALSHLNHYSPEVEAPLTQYAKAAKMTNSVHWIGMCENDEFEKIMETGAQTIRIIKPYKDDAKVLDQIAFAEEKGALAVGIDIDHTFTEDGNLDVIMNECLENKTMQQMEAYVEKCHIPFVIKGVLSVHDALACKEIGAQGIVVSHHGGRMKYAVPPMVVLPEIVEAVGDCMPIFMDGGIQSGADVYKALASGATAVSVGTHLMPILMKQGTEAVVQRMIEMECELKGYMANTGVEDLHHFDPTVLHRVRGV